MLSLVKLKISSFDMSVSVIELDWRLFGAPDGAPLSPDLDRLI